MVLHTVRAAGWALTMAFVIALPTMADYEAGQRALEAGQPAEAFRHWREAAETGDGRAMLALGRLYRQGLGVLQNYVVAHKWFNIAASRGEAEAATERDALATKMTPQQVAEAQERAAGWQRDTHPVPGASDTATSRSNETAATAADAGPPPPRAIREAQSLLRALGYRPGPADGIWGRRTEAAYRAFLRDAGLPTTEMLTPEALRALRAVAKRRGHDGEDNRAAIAERTSTGAATPGAATVPLDALHRAAQAGDIERLKAVLGAGVDVDARDGRGWTALMYAVDKRYPLLVESLLEVRADPDLRAPDGATPLFIAAAHGHSEIIEQLMEVGADITVTGPDGKTAVDVARARWGDPDTVRESSEKIAVLALSEGMTLAEHMEAERTSDDSAFTEAKSKGTADAYQRYLLEYPNGRYSTEVRRLHTDAMRVEARQQLASRIADKAFSGTYANGNRITYRFLSTGKVVGTYDAGSFFGIPGTTPCSGKWHINEKEVQFNCDYGLGGSNISVTAKLDGAVLICREKSWMGIEIVHLTN